MFTIPNQTAASHADQARLDSGDLAVLAAGISGDGVLSGCAVTAQGSPDMTVAVAIGTVQIAGASASVASGNVTITTADGSNPRFDLIVVNASGTKSAVAGTPDTAPLWPAIPASSVVLAEVYVPASATTITSTRITDKRAFVSSPPAAALDDLSDVTLTSPAPGNVLTHNGTTWVNQATFVFDIKGFGGLGDDSTDDTTAITTCIAATSAGDCIYWPPGTYLVSSTISLPPNRSYQGNTRRDTVLKMADAANLDAIAAAEVWLSASATPTSDGPINVVDLGFDGNRANQTGGDGHGLVLMNYYSKVESLEISDTLGDGLRWTTTTAAGHLVSNTMVENHINRVQVYNPGGHGIHVEDASFNKLTDGWVNDCAVNMNSSGLDGIFIDSSAGWKIDGNHVYGSPHNGINVNRPAWTRVVNNYVETFGSSSDDTQYAGIGMGTNRGTWIATAGWSVVANNTVILSADNTGADNIGISAYAASSGTGEVVITGNALSGVSGRTYGIYVANQSSSATLRVHLAGNRARGWSTPYGGAAASGTLEITGPDAFPLALSTSATVGFARVPSCAGAPTGTPDDLTAGIPVVFDTTNHRLYFYENSGWHYAARTA